MAPPATCQVAVWPRSPGSVQLYYYFRLLYSSVMSAMSDTRHPLTRYRARHIRYHKFRYISDTRGIGWPRNGWHSWRRQRLSILALTNWISVECINSKMIYQSPNKAAIDRQKWLVYHLADTECRFVNISIFISISEYSHHGEISKLNVNVCNSTF